MKTVEQGVCQELLEVKRIQPGVGLALLKVGATVVKHCSDKLKRVGGEASGEYTGLIALEEVSTIHEGLSDLAWSVLPTDGGELQHPLQVGEAWYDGVRHSNRIISDFAKDVEAYSGRQAAIIRETVHGSLSRYVKNPKSSEDTKTHFDGPKQLAASLLAKTEQFDTEMGDGKQTLIAGIQLRDSLKSDVESHRTDQSTLLEHLADPHAESTLTASASLMCAEETDGLPVVVGNDQVPQVIAKHADAIRKAKRLLEQLEDATMSSANADLVRAKEHFATCLFVDAPNLMGALLTAAGRAGIELTTFAAELDELNDSLQTDGVTLLPPAACEAEG